MAAPPPPDHQSWTTWFQQHGPKLLVCARQWARSAADAEDVVQEAFIRFWRTQRQLGGDPLGLLLISIRRSALDLARRETRRAARETAALDVAPPQPEALFQTLSAGDERRDALESALARLPLEQREVLVLKIWGERTFEEIGNLCGISPNTAASRYRYGLNCIRRKLSPFACHE